ncbi:DHDH.2 family protein [Megaselia abdita]
MTTLRWGIASAGKISNDFAVGLSCLPKQEHTILAIAARDLKRSEVFAKLHGIPKAYASYAELARNPDIDVVYIGSVNTEHLDISKLMLENGKHVLCEKPLCLNRKQSSELVELARSKKLFLMEAIWSRFFPAYTYLRQLLANGALGRIQSIDVGFGFDLKSVDRLQKKELGGGTVLDLGVYTIQLCQWVAQEAPSSIESTGELNEEGVDVAVSATLKYPSGIVANMSTSAKEMLSNTAVIKGTKGETTLNMFWCPTSLIGVDGGTKSWDLPKTDKFLNFPNSQGLGYQAVTVRDCIFNKKLESNIVSHNESILIASIQDTIRKQIGVRFPQD